MRGLWHPHPSGVQYLQLSDWPIIFHTKKKASNGLIVNIYWQPQR